MRIESIRLRGFRNHFDTSIELSPGINVFLGENGEGKTSVVEAISFLSLTKSFYAASDSVVCQIGAGAFEIDGVIASDAGVDHYMRVVYDHQRGVKQCTINHAKPESLSSVVGRFPAVILSPEISSVTFGGPAERRRFLDVALSQLSRSYLEDLLEYRRALRQRNKVLSDARIAGVKASSALEPWTISLVLHGSKVIHRRFLFVQEFRKFLQESYEKLVDKKEAPDMELSTFEDIPLGASGDDVACLMEKKISSMLTDEFRRGTSLVGPHRDELLLTLNGNSIQKYASQGQHKSMLVAMKAAEFDYIRQKRNEVPVFLLDDVFSELDEGRARRVIDLLKACGQTVITTTDESRFHNGIPWGNGNKKFEVQNGSCRETKD